MRDVTPAMRRPVLPAMLLVAGLLSACATGSRQADAGSAGGFAPDRLGVITRTVQKDIDAKRVPGVVMLIARNGKLEYEQALGQRNPTSGEPMTADSIFRIYSMTKPIVSVGAMMLVEDGKLLISDPVSKYLPEMKNLKVGLEKTGADGKPVLELVPAAREMTVQDLLRHTSGLTYGVFGKSLVKSEYLKAGIHKGEYSNAELVAQLGKLPLAYQPGSTWEYSRSTDVLGALIERVSGQTLDAYLRERILTPLKMHDTGFWVEPEKQKRIAEPFDVDPDTKAPIKLLNVRKQPKFESGGGGMVSTARDYLRFAQMLLNEGELDGVRILSPKTVRYMTSDHLSGTDIKASGPGFLPGPGYGFGLGVGVRTEPGVSGTAGTVGDYSWGGLGGTYFWVDPREKMVAVWMAQGPGQRNYYRQLYRNQVYAAMD